MTALSTRLIEDLQLRGLSKRPQERSVRAVRPLAEHSHPSPDHITEEALRQSFLPLKHVKPYSRSASPLALCGLTFFSEPTLKRAWTTLTFVRPPREQKLPGLLRVEEVRTMLAKLTLPRYRVCLTTMASCGLRLQEGTHLPIPAIDRSRLLVPVRDSTGATDRDGPLPQSTLE